MVATEVVENRVWGDAWLSNISTPKPDEVWQADVRAVQQFIGAVEYIEGPVDLAALFNIGMRLDFSHILLSK